MKQVKKKRIRNCGASGVFAESSSVSESGWPEQVMCEGDRRDAATQTDKVGRVSMIVWYEVAVNIMRKMGMFKAT